MVTLASGGNAAGAARLRERARSVAPADDAQPRGLTQLSDQARQALDDCRSPRISGHTLPSGTLPFSSTRAERAGKNVLNTPMGRFWKPGGALRMNGVIVSDHVMTMRSPPPTMVSVTGAGGEPARVGGCGLVHGLGRGGGQVALIVEAE